MKNEIKRVERRRDSKFYDLQWNVIDIIKRLIIWDIFFKAAHGGHYSLLFENVMNAMQCIPSNIDIITLKLFSQNRDGTYALK